MDPPLLLHLREFQALVDRAGGRGRLLLVGEAREGDPAPRALLETFARDLFAEPEPRKEQEAEAAARAQPDPDPPGGARRVRVRVGGRGSAARSCPPCALLFVLFREASLAPLPPPHARRERLRLREILCDVRSQLPSAALPGVVGVVVLGSGGPPGEGEGARLQLDALLRQVFRRRRPAEHDTLQAAPYSPGAGQGAAEARAAACRALRAALKLRAEGAEAKKQRIPAFLQCIPWARRSRRKEGHPDAAPSNFSEDALQDPEEGVSLTNMEPNGNCEEACGAVAT
ncbi:uncharacterized protein C2orf72 homolog [Zootoca vivipara]|uniref:uncharacterized protein C2orf72 homolog n=1 Tax=Zootoca vivipara TaxID=8524 RepID=UPI00159271E4|nr:uncharacterized protein C2orf72 homolog [Zootoca vivipara]